MSELKNIANEMQAEDDIMPRSTCSIDENPHACSSKKGYSHH